MGLNLRKIAIGVMALGVLAGVFALYLWLSRTPPIVADEVRPTPTPLTEVNRPDAKRAPATIQGITVRRVWQTEFIHRNEFNRMDRKFGFEELLHERAASGKSPSRTCGCTSIDSSVA